MSEHLKELHAYLNNKGFIYGPEPEIYGGLAGFYTYGPLGKLLKNNVEAAIRRVFQKESFFEVECPTIMPSVVWEASGHLGGFTDPLISCSKCKANFRVDHLLQEVDAEIQVENAPSDKLLELVNEKKLTCPSCKGAFTKKIKQHTLMMGTTIGIDTEAYARPETATTTYLPFLRYADFFRKKLPFGVFQIGKAYRNEISPRQHVVRAREFTQAEGQLFIHPEQKKEFEAFEDVKTNSLPLWTHEDQDAGKKHELIELQDAMKKGLLGSQAYAWTLALSYELFLSMGIPANKMRFRQHGPDEKAFYAADAWDLEINLNSFGWTECCGIHDRTNYDLKQHAEKSKKDLLIDVDGEKILPHILEIAFGTDRPTFALLDLFYELKEKEEGKTILKIPYQLAPIQCAVFSLVNKLNEPTQEVYKKLQKEFVCIFDRSGAIGKRYLRADSIGIPYSITYDFSSLENDTVTLRDRDTTKQIRVAIDDLPDTLHDLLKGELSFEKAGKLIE